MRCAIALYLLVNPFRDGSYSELLELSPLPGEEPPQVWLGCLRDWMLNRLRAGMHEFGMYYAEIVPLDEQERPDEEALDDLIEQDIGPLMAEISWSGSSELVPAG